MLIDYHFYKILLLAYYHQHKNSKQKPQNKKSQKLSRKEVCNIDSVTFTVLLTHFD